MMRWGRTGIGGRFRLGSSVTGGVRVAIVWIVLDTDEACRVRGPESHKSKGGGFS